MSTGLSTSFILRKSIAIKMLFILFSFLILNSCSEYVSAPQEGNTANKASLYEKQCSEDQCPCSTPLGVIKHGTKITVYGSPEVSCGRKCEEQTSEVSCNNGKLSPGIEGKFFTCSMLECKSCTIENNLIRHGESAFLYSKANANCSESCIDFKAERKCNDGKLEGDLNFKYSICQNRLCTCDLPEGGTALTLGGKMNFFKNTKAACGTKCSDAIQSRTCEEHKGLFSFNGDPAFKKTTCQEASGCECQLPNAQGSVKDGDVLFLTSHLEVACGNECKPEYTVPVKCSNGILLNTKDNSSINILTTPYILKGSCVVKACQNCIVDQTTQTSVSHGTKRKFYKAASPTCGNHCDSKEKTCTDGTFLPADASFVSNTCAERKCSCDVPDQSQVSLGVGLQQPFYKVLKTSDRTNNTPGCGKSCENADVKELKTCTEVYENGTYNYKFLNIAANQSTVCSQTPGCDCQLPNGQGKILDKAVITLSATAVVACGQTCATQDNVNLLCDSGQFRNASTNAVVDVAAVGFKYINSCKEANCTACTLPNYGTISNNTKITLYPKESFVCGENPTLLSSEFFCASGVLLRNGQNNVDTGGSWYASITNNCKGCTTPWNVTVAFGASVNFYKQSGTVSNPCGQGCKMATRKCLPDGKFEGPETDYTDYKLSACTNNCSESGGGAPPRLCLLPWQNSYVTPDAKIPMWSRKTVGCGESCQTYFKFGRCQMETGIFDSGFDFYYQSCTEVCP